MYEMNINAGVSGVEQLERLGTATEKQTERTKRIDDAIKNYTASNDKLAIKLLDIEKNEVRLEQLREQHRIQTERLAAAVDKRTASQERLNAAVKNSVSDVQAASASIRAFEGNLPIRAVEQFATKVLGLGGVFQALFPVVGAIAMTEALGKGVEKLGEMYNAWNPVLTAQEKSLKILKDSNSEFDSLIKKSDQYRLDRYERENGRVARLRLEASEASGDASYNDAARVSYIRGKIAAQQAIIDTPNRTTTISRASGDFSQTTGPSESAREVARTTLRGLEQELEEAVLKQSVDNLKAEDLRAKAKEAESKKADKAESAAIELRKRAAEAMAAAYFGNGAIGKAAYAQVRLRMEEADAVRRNPGEESSIRGSYTLLRAAANQQRTDAEATRTHALTQEGYALDDVSARMLGQDDQDILSRILSPSAPSPQSGYRSERDLVRSGQLNLRNIRDTERQYMGVARVSAQLSGQSERGQADSLYGSRVQFAEQEYQAELRLADLKKTESEREAAREDALDQKHQKLFDAQMEREKTILEMVLRQKQEFEKNFVGLIHALASGHLGDFIVRRLESLGDEILAKLGGKLFDVILRRAGRGTISVRDAIGGAAKDPADVQATNDNTVATDDNTRALRDLTSVLLMGHGGGASGTIGFPSGSGGPGVMGGANSTIMYGMPPSGGAGGGSSRMAQIGGYAAAAGIGYKGLSDIFRGGGKNVSGGIGEVAMAAAIVDPEPVSKAILAGVGMAASIVSSLFGDSKAARARQISNTLSFGRFLDPVSINASMTTQGGFADFDRFGGIRGSDLSPFPMVDQPYIDHFHDVTVPGRTSSQFGGRGGGPVNVHVYALDAKSIVDRHQDIGDAVMRAIDAGHTGLQEKLRSF